VASAVFAKNIRRLGAARTNYGGMFRRKDPRAIAIIVALAVGLQLAACDLLNKSSPAPTAPPPPPAPPQAVAPLPPTPARPPPPKPATRPPGNPNELVGLDEQAVRRLLGAPAAIANDGAARVLTYRADGCELEVFLFLDVSAGNLRVLSYQLHAGRSRATQTKACYDDLRSGR
jgi:hypothetical protein